jgi:membrane protein
VKRYKDRFFGEINGLIGNEAAAQIQEVIKNTASGKTTFLLLWVVLRYLLTTTVLAKSRFYQYYLEFKSKTKRGWLKWVRSPTLSLDCWFKFFINCFFMVNGVLLALNDWLSIIF